MKRIIRTKVSKILLIIILVSTGCGMMIGLTGCRQKLTFSGYLDNSNAYFESDEIDIEFVAGIYITYSKPNSKGEIVIPSEVDGQPVVGIDGNFSIDCRRTLKKIIIPKSIKVIRGGAFNQCSELKTVIFEEGSELLAIGRRAFESTENLKSIILPEKLEHIASFAFAASGIENITIPDGVKCLSREADVELPSGSIWHYGRTFVDCKNLKNVTLNDNLEWIGIGVFDGVKNISSIIIPKNVTYVDITAFLRWTEEQTIYFEHPSKPEDWESVWDNWSSYDRSSAKIVWGFQKGSATKSKTHIFA